MVSYCERNCVIGKLNETLQYATNMIDTVLLNVSENDNLDHKRKVFYDHVPL
jgi:hypothetical protein